METVKCSCGGPAFVEFRGDIIRVQCDECGKFVASVPKKGETEREQMKRTVRKWNNEQEKSEEPKGGPGRWRLRKGI